MFGYKVYSLQRLCVNLQPKIGARREGGGIDKGGLKNFQILKGLRGRKRQGEISILSGR